MTPLNKIAQALLIAFWATGVQAVGFGEITLQSRVGENLRASVPVFVRNDEPPDVSCFAMVRDDSQELPVPAGINLRLIRQGSNFVLQLRGTRPLAEPVFALTIRANCDMELQRTYVLIPEAPVVSPLGLAQEDSNAAEEAPRAPPPRRGERTLPAEAGDTLNDIARRLTGDDPRRQARQLAALLRANPDIAADDILAEGSEVRLSQRPSPPRKATPRARPARSVATAPATTANSDALPGPDRLRIEQAPLTSEGAAVPNTPLSATTSTPPPQTLEEVNARIRRMEQTVRALHEEVTKLDAALLEANRALAARNRQQLVIEQQTLPATRPSSNYQEILFAALLGGLSVALISHLLSRRRERRAEREIPLMMQGGYRPEVRVDTETPPNTLIDASETAADETMRDIGVRELTPGNNAEELDIVNLLLASGRQRGAAEVLARHIDATSPDDIKPWQMLLDLYRNCGMQQEFEELSRRVEHKFAHNNPPDSPSQ